MPKKTLPPRGFMFATMEPPSALEEEFQDWYDTEHFPERAGCDGFDRAMRFVCIDGWPRYLAAYDLADPGVLARAGYAAIAVKRYTPWTHRIIAKVWGQYRAAGTQVYPGRALYGDGGASARLVLWRFRNVAAGAETGIVAAMRAAYEGRPETAQVRVFLAPQGESADCIALIELRWPCAAPALDVALLGAAARCVDAVNTYVPYQRQNAGAFPAVR
jgi:hypothetical protein